jgi:radical SAM protein with 4Fe4S-binding SPASM domain
MLVKSPAIKVVHGNDGTLVCDAQTKRVFKIHPAVGDFIERPLKYPDIHDLEHSFQKHFSAHGVSSKNGKDPKIHAYLKQLVGRGLYVDEKEAGLIPAFDSLFMLPATPQRAKIELLSKCNFSCPHCYLSATMESKPKIPKAKVLHLIDELSDLKVKEIQFTGGEPMLSKNLPTYIRHARNKGCSVKVTTNGSLLTRDSIEFFQENSVELQIGVYAVSPSMAERRKIPEKAYLRVLKNIEFISEIMPEKLTLSLTIIDETQEEIDKFIDLAKRNNVQYLIARAIGAGRGKNLERLSGKPGTSEKDKTCLADSKNTVQKGEVVFKDRPCSFNSIDIMSNGDVTNCILMRSGEAVVGNIYVDSLKKIWFGKQNQKVRNTHVDMIPVCNTCEQRYLCGGGCMAAGFNEYGSMFHPYPYCRIKQVEVSNYLKKSFCQQKQTKHINHHSQHQTNQGNRPG